MTEMSDLCHLRKPRVKTIQLHKSPCIANVLIKSNEKKMSWNDQPLYIIVRFRFYIPANLTKVTCDVRTLYIVISLHVIRLRTRIQLFQNSSLFNNEKIKYYSMKVLQRLCNESRDNKSQQKLSLADQTHVMIIHLIDLSRNWRC